MLNAMPQSSQVVIVGAGPAGGAAAVRLAQRGITDVILLDKDPFPRNKTCGSALSPNGVRLVDELGIGEEVRRLGYAIHSLRLKTPGDREMHFTTKQAAIVLLRKHFDNLLVERACTLGVDFRSSWKAVGLIENNGRAVGVRGRSGAKEVEVRARCILCCDGAHSIFRRDPRPLRTISTLMGWWEDFAFEPGTMEMVFDTKLSPLYGWMFPETSERVNIGICMDGENENGGKTSRNVRDVFQQFLSDHFRDRLHHARQIGRFRGHPISYTTWIDHCTAPGVVYTGEAARITHNATGEGIWQAMQSGIYAADMLADVVEGRKSEEQAFYDYTQKLRKRFTFAFFMGHILRGALRTPLLDAVALIYNRPLVRRFASWAIGSALAGSQLSADESAMRERDIPSPMPLS
jgi:geranylgeranyl reductase family protein